MGLFYVLIAILFLAAALRFFASERRFFGGSIRDVSRTTIFVVSLAIVFAVTFVKMEKDDIREMQEILASRKFIESSLQEDNSENRRWLMQKIEDSRNNEVRNAKNGYANPWISVFYGKLVASLPITDIVSRYEKSVP